MSLINSLSSWTDYKAMSTPHVVEFLLDEGPYPAPPYDLRTWKNVLVLGMMLLSILIHSLDARMVSTLIHDQRWSLRFGQSSVPAPWWDSPRCGQALPRASAY